MGAVEVETQRVRRPGCRSEPGRRRPCELGDPAGEAFGFRAFEVGAGEVGGDQGERPAARSASGASQRRRPAAVAASPRRQLAAGAGADAASAAARAPARRGPWSGSAAAGRGWRRPAARPRQRRRARPKRRPAGSSSASGGTRSQQHRRPLPSPLRKRTCATTRSGHVAQQLAEGQRLEVGVADQRLEARAQDRRQVEQAGERQRWPSPATAALAEDPRRFWPRVRHHQAVQEERGQREDHHRHREEAEGAEHGDRGPGQRLAVGGRRGPRRRRGRAAPTRL